MVVKIFTAATIVAAMAGSMVYFGTQPAGTSGTIKIESNASEVDETGATRKIVSRYIGSDDSIVESESTPSYNAELIDDNPYVVDAEGTETGHPHPPRAKRKSEEEVVEVEVIDPDQVVPSLTEEEADYPAVGSVIELEISEASIDAGLVSEPEDEVMPVEIVEEVPPTHANRVKRSDTRTLDKDQVSHDDPAMQRIKVVFEQALNIEQIDLRDRAYLDLSDYATSKGLFGQAERAALKINQVELRDTARSRIAMGLARYGKSDEAFALIEAVEVSELRDVMRLQVIEALLGTNARR